MIGDTPGHVRGVVSDAELAVGAEENDAAVSAEALEEVADGLLCGQFGSDSLADPVGGPFSQD